MWEEKQAALAPALTKNTFNSWDHQAESLKRFLWKTQFIYVQKLESLFEPG